MEDQDQIWNRTAAGGSRFSNGGELETISRIIRLSPAMGGDVADDALGLTKARRRPQTNDCKVCSIGAGLHEVLVSSSCKVVRESVLPRLERLARWGTELWREMSRGPSADATSSCEGKVHRSGEPGSCRERVGRASDLPTKRW